MKQRTFFMLKPDGVKLEEEILARIKSVAEIVAIKKYARLPLEKIAQLYEEHKDKPFYPWLVDYLKDNPATLMILEKKDGLNEDLFSLIDKLVGSTDPKKALPGTIRSLSPDSLEVAYSQNRAVQNLVHRSENETTAQREAALFFDVF